ncbi:MAG: nitrogenase cofactor biosynthesis protein NifB [Sporomusaceae bacterium]|nr:nitrogenase cofactor biosynthesis protein NifB [Sporomusaceae bacterium]
MDAERHPCYSADAQHKFARLHLPVAPACNISCNYCSRKYDCVNESRPGVTSEVLSPAAAAAKFSLVKEKIANLSVVGIAGPGDALANWPRTRETLELVRAKDPEIIFCLSTNGLMLPEYAQEIIALGARHVTVTVNCVDPDIGAAIYRQVTYKGETYSGRAGAELLMAKQLAGIAALVAGGVLVKVNIVMIGGVNDRHIPAVVKTVKDLGVFVTNIMPMISAPGSAFEYLPQTSMKEVTAMRDLCQLDIRQMRHCRQCRADAVGLLAEDRSA